MRKVKYVKCFFIPFCFVTTQFSAGHSCVSPVGNVALLQLSVCYGAALCFPAVRTQELLKSVLAIHQSQQQYAKYNSLILFLHIHIWQSVLCNKLPSNHYLP